MWSPIIHSRHLARPSSYKMHEGQSAPIRDGSWPNQTESGARLKEQNKVHGFPLKPQCVLVAVKLNFAIPRGDVRHTSFQPARTPAWRCGDLPPIPLPVCPCPLSKRFSLFPCHLLDLLVQLPPRGNLQHTPRQRVVWRIRKLRGGKHHRIISS